MREKSIKASVKEIIVQTAKRQVTVLYRDGKPHPQQKKTKLNPHLYF